jgi:hypothetical protein
MSEEICYLGGGRGRPRSVPYDLGFLSECRLNTLCGRRRPHSEEGNS